MKNTTISTQTKNEIMQTPINNECCQKAFLLGLFKGVGYIAINNLEWWVGFTFHEMDLVLFSSEIIASLLKTKPTVIEKKKEGAFQASYSIDLDAGTSRKLFELWNIDFRDNNSIYSSFSLINSECCKKAVLKALFLSVGSLSIPSQRSQKDVEKKNGYHLELRIFSEEMAQDIWALLSSFGIQAKIRQTKVSHSVYIKDCESISDFLAAIEAVNSLFKLQDMIMYRSISNDSNRGRNCNVANIRKSVNAATSQIDSILYIEANYGLKNLSDELYLLAKARLEHPEFTLSDLAECLGNTTKSGVNHRMRKIMNLAEKLQSKE